MLEEMNKLISLLAKEVLPPDIELYSTDSGQVLFENKGIIIKPNLHVAYLIKNIAGFRLSYMIKFKDLQLINDNGIATVKRALPYLKDGIRKAAKEFGDNLADPVKLNSVIDEQKKRNEQLPISLN